MGSGQPRPKPVKLTDARTGEPRQRERESAGTVTEAIDRRTIRQAIMTQLLTEIAEEILKSGVKIDVFDENGKLVKPGNFKDYYERKDKDDFPLLRALIEDPETAFNTRRNKLSVVEYPDDRNIEQPFGSINLTVFRSAMALGDGKSPLKTEEVQEVAKRVVIRAGRSSGYGPRAGAGYGEPPSGEKSSGENSSDRGFAGCK